MGTGGAAQPGGGAAGRVGRGDRGNEDRVRNAGPPRTGAAFAWHSRRPGEREDAMRYLALATDYDGTLATAGRVTAPTLAALERLRQSGRRLLLVTGRELED